MSSTDATPGECDLPPELCAFPDLALTAAVDDEDEPAELTVYPADATDERLRTAWITVALDDAVALDAVR